MTPLTRFKSDMLQNYNMIVYFSSEHPNSAWSFQKFSPTEFSFDCHSFDVSFILLKAENILFIFTVGFPRIGDLWRKLVVFFVGIGVWSYQEARRDKAGGDGIKGCGVQGNESSSWDCKICFCLFLLDWSTTS